MQFGFMFVRGTIDAVFMLRRMQEEYNAKGKSISVFLWTWRKLLQNTEESVGMGNEEERSTRSFC